MVLSEQEALLSWQCAPGFEALWFVPILAAAFGLARKLPPRRNRAFLPSEQRFLSSFNLLGFEPRLAEAEFAIADRISYLQLGAK